MIKRFILLFILFLVASCGTNNTVVRTSKPDGRKSKSTTVHTTKKIVYTPTENVIDDDGEQTKQPSVSNQDNSSVVLEATTRVKVTTKMVLAYIEKYKEIAKENMIKKGIPASITLGQAILESGAGTGPLSIQANNHFGIKCHKEWRGASIKYTDDEENECFRKYTDPKESFRDHSFFLTSRSRYSNLFLLGKNDYIGWANGLKLAGYATDLKYPEKLIGLIQRYQLDQYDAQVLGKVYNPLAISAQTTIQNKEEIYTVNKGDTLYSISKKHNISVADLKKKNNLSNTTLALGQRIMVK